MQLPSHCKHFSNSNFINKINNFANMYINSKETIKKTREEVPKNGCHFDSAEE